MIKKLASIAALLAAFLTPALAQENKGIKFTEASVSELLKMAEKENKLVFIDCYTSWCGPCKKMARDLFPQPQVGEFMNANFINAKIDMEKGEGPELGKKYNVQGYPTLLILNSKGEELHRLVGGQKADEFIDKIKEGMGENSLGKMKQAYDNGNRKPEFLLQYLNKLVDAYNPDYKKVLNEYWNCLDDKQRQSMEGWNLIKRFGGDPNSPLFQYLLNNRAAFIALTDTKTVNGKIKMTYNVILDNTLTEVVYNRMKFDQKFFDDYKAIIQKESYEGKEVELGLIELSYAYNNADISYAFKVYKDYFSAESCDLKIRRMLFVNAISCHRGNVDDWKRTKTFVEEQIKACQWGTQEGTVAHQVLSYLDKKISEK